MRNSYGEALAGGAWPLNNLLNATVAEAMARRLGLQLLDEVGCSPIIIESDCLELINACNGETDIWSPCTAILADCFQIAHRIGRVTFKFCPREANKAAHNLARLSFDSDSVFKCESDPPLSVLVDVLNDVTPLLSE